MRRASLLPRRTLIQRSSWTRTFAATSQKPDHSEKSSDNSTPLSGTSFISAKARQFAQTFKESLQQDQELKSTLKEASQRLGEAPVKAIGMAQSLAEEARKRTEHLDQLSQRVREAIPEPVKKAAEKTGETLAEALDSNAAAQVSNVMKSVADNVIDEHTQLAYGGIKSREGREKIKKERVERYRQRQQALAEAAAAEAALPAEELARLQAERQAGNVVLHQRSKLRASWDAFKEQNPIFQAASAMQERYALSNNVFISSFRNMTESVSHFIRNLGNTEEQRVLAEIRRRDPDFDHAQFLLEVREFILPELLQAYYRFDLETLRIWTSESAFAQLFAVIKAHQDLGLSLAQSHLVDLRHVELITAAEVSDQPVLLYQALMQQVQVTTDAKGKVHAGNPHVVARSVVRIVLTREETYLETEENCITHGWRVLEFAMGKGEAIW